MRRILQYTLGSLLALALSNVAHAQIPLGLRGEPRPITAPIPIFDSLLITHDGFKWGVVDSLGKVIVPFEFDGIKVLDETKAIACRYHSSYSLNTGIPRYSYSGEYFYFGPHGLTGRKPYSFNKTVSGRSDFYWPEQAIDWGHEFFTPMVIDGKPQERSSSWR